MAWVEVRLLSARSGNRRLAWLVLSLLAPLMMMPGKTSAAEVSMPLNIDYITLAQALKQRMYTGPAGHADLWNGSDSCQFLHATNPRFASQNGSLVLETDAELSVGATAGDRCLSPLEWSGIIEVETAAYIGPGLSIKFRVTNVNLYNTNHEKSLFVGRGFDLIKSKIIPQLETFVFDLKPPIQLLDSLVEAGAGAEAADRVKTVLATVRASAVIPEDQSLRVTLLLALPEAAAPMPSVSAGPLTQAELDAWQGLLDNWDAFAVFAVKQLGAATPDLKVRAELFDILIDGRYRLVQALQQPQAEGADPIRILFLGDWNRLGTLIRSLAQRGMLSDRTLEFLSFVSAGDALFAFDQAAPTLGVRISADDLRRLARIMAPQYAADPLAFDFDLDPQLQQMFGVSAPLESPGPFEEPSSGESSTAVPTSGPSARPLAPLSGIPSVHSMFQMSLRMIDPEEASAAENPLVSQLFAIGVALNRLVVDTDNARDYARSVEKLLSLTAEREIDEAGLAPGLRHTYLLVTKSTGWQESCWRQFVLRGGRVRFLESSTGDIGIMQVNKHVWRGFYRLSRLEWDIVYNTGAGAEILMRLMRDAPSDLTGAAGDQLTALARSTYSAYNGGPDAYHRWRRREEPAETRQIDHAFWLKYQALTSGQSFDILQCAAQWDTAHGH